MTDWHALPDIRKTEVPYNGITTRESVAVANDNKIPIIMLRIFTCLQTDNILLMSVKTGICNSSYSWKKQ